MLLTVSRGGSGTVLIVWVIALVVLMYFMMIRPNRREQAKKNDMFSRMAVGDTVLTTSGFYGTLIDVQEDIVIVEFGNNKNCRIPMQRSAIVQIEKPEDAIDNGEPEVTDVEPKKKGFFGR